MERMSSGGAGAGTRVVPWSGKDKRVFYRGSQQW